MDNSRRFIFVKSCADCKEIMPAHETVCYCGGPVKLIKTDDKEMISLAKSYKNRRWLHNYGENRK